MHKAGGGAKGGVCVCGASAFEAEGQPERDKGEGVCAGSRIQLAKAWGHGAADGAKGLASRV